MTAAHAAAAPPAVTCTLPASAPARARSDLAEALAHAIEEGYARARGSGAGKVADYIPELARADPGLFGVAACTVQGEVLSIGDDRHAFTLQSISKPLAYGLAVARHGVEAIRRKVGVEPTGDRFNAIVFERATNRPHNPMVNAGAIAVSSTLVGAAPGAASGPAGAGVGTGAGAGAAAEGGLAGLLRDFGRFAGRGPLDVDVPVYLSEASTGHRNRAIAYLMRQLGIIEGAIEDGLDLYFQQCSTLVDVRDLAVIGATLANGGVCPTTGERVLEARVVAKVLALMATCGLYDGSGAFALKVGLPAKSGVAGGLLAVAPGLAGLAAFSPPLDAEGNSVRAVGAIGHVADTLGLHAFAVREIALPPRDLAPALEAARAAGRQRSPGDEPGGAPASYIPELARVDPGLFGLAAVTADGREWACGDADVPFTIQSAATPFTYALALEARGLAAVHAKVGMEPSGNPYNAIVFGRDNRPMNPLVNAGAIALCSLVPGSNSTERLQRLLGWVEGFAGERVHVDMPVFLSEKRAGDKNRAIACMLRNVGLLEDEGPALDLYLQQCSIRATTRLLARMAATLAFGGRNPKTGKQALAPDLVMRVLATMYTCGMNDRSGLFAFEVGLCAKSGVAGGILAVAPGRLGVGVYAPPVDEHGNSVPGVRALKHLSGALGLGLFDRPA